MSTDERRARGIAWGVRPHLHRHYDANQNWSVLPPKDRLKYLGIARAIRTSDEAAGMVLVPRELISRCGANAMNCLHAPEVRAMLAAATEIDNG